jgi:hypothetical protein
VDSSNAVYARQFNDPTIYKQTSPGTFTSFRTLIGGALNSQSSVVLNGNMTEYDAMNAGTVSRWDLSGNFLGSVTLTGFGTLGAENSFPQNRTIAAVGSNWLTYDGAGNISAWSAAGSRVGETHLNGAGTTFDSGLSLSYANGRVFIVDNAGGNWRGFPLGLGTSSGAVPTPTLTTWGMIVLGGALLLFGMKAAGRSAAA